MTRLFHLPRGNLRVRNSTLARQRRNERGEKEGGEREEDRARESVCVCVRERESGRDGRTGFFETKNARPYSRGARRGGTIEI